MGNAKMPRPFFMSANAAKVVAPGQVVAEASGGLVAGDGVYERAGRLVAALVGLVRFAETGEGQRVVSVVRVNEAPTLVPKKGDVVIARVVKVTTRFAKVQILCVDDIPLKSEFPALIRQADVRLTQIDQVHMYKCFRPGDVVRAEVISLGDKNSYYLSTASNDYGVIFAQSVAGATMVPVSWELMQCPKTKVTEFRKVAKV